MLRETLPLRRFELVLTVVVCSAFLLMPGCNGFFVIGGRSCFNETPIPKLSSVSPATIDTQALPVTVTVTGSNFQTWSKIFWNGADLPTTYIDSHHLSTVVTPELMTGLFISNGTALISVSTAGQPMGDLLGCPNGGFTATFVIIVN